MVLNNKGQVIFYTFMIMALIFVIALALVPVVKNFVDDARAPTSETAVGLDCSNNSISDYQKGQCMITDLATPYWFFGLLSIAALIVGAKVVLG